MQSTPHHGTVRALLRPSEDLQCILDVQRAPEDKRTQAHPSVGLATHTLPSQLIAVVTHRDHSQDTALGSLLVLSASTATATAGVKVVDALPITEHLAFSVAQAGPLDSQTVDSGPGVPVETRTAWSLTFRRNAQDTNPLTFTVGTRDTQKLHGFTTECRRLRELAVEIHPVDTDFAWVEAYTSDSSSHRLDLRLRTQPLHMRLSPAIAGLPDDDVTDISIVRRDLIERAAAQDAKSGNVNSLKIRLGTFNVNGKSPSQDLYPWLRGSESRTKTGWISSLEPPQSKAPSDLERRENDLLAGTGGTQAFGDPDILVLGFQELDQSAEALLYTTSTLKEDEWLTALFAGLGEKRVLYEKLISRQLVGMLLVVIVKKALSPCFTGVWSCDAGSGIMGFMGNKGATAIRLEFTPKVSSDPQTVYRSTVLTFVNAHLAASDEMVDRRNYDFQELSGRLAFSRDGLSGNYIPVSSAYDVYQSDVLFWMVHLNYRLDLADGDIRKLLFSHVSGIDEIRTLLLYDQLGAAIRSNKAFSGFTEHPVTHPPTYRLAQAVTSDRLGYDIKRKPAWTDRILYMASPDVRLAQRTYRSHPEIAMSDHQPVSADFDISLVLVDQSRYESALLALHNKLAGFESPERKPKIRVQPTSIEFGTIKYEETIRREMILQNVGDIPCVFRFVGTGGDSEPISPSWLHIGPMAGLLQPREITTVLMSAYVDKDSAARLNLGSPTLECTLILHTALGKDDFVAVSGNYQYTCFANTLERLTRLDRPIGKLTSPEEVMPAGQAINAPREIMRLINWMMTHVSANEGAQGSQLFENAAEERLCHVIRECLDTDDEFPSEEHDRDRHVLAVAFANTLVSFLDSLTEPVVPARFHAECLRVKDRDEAFEVLNVLPHESINVWISLTAFLHYFARQGESRADRRGARRLASIFASVLLRDDPTGVYPKASPVGKRDFILHFIG